MNIEQYIAENSKKIKPVFMKELARGGEAVVYRIEHTGLEEVVAKCTLKGSGNTFLEIMNESQMLKLLQNEDCICSVKEEIIEMDKDTNQITNYTVIVE